MAKDQTAAPADKPARAEISDVERVFWESIADSEDQAEYELYLADFPKGAFAALARRRIEQLASRPAKTASAASADPDFVPVTPRKAVVNIPPPPVPKIDGEIPRYLLMAPFFAENDTFYPADTEINYRGAPNEHMYPLNEAARRAKAEMDEYLDACWRAKLKAEGKPDIPRPRELADQIEQERKALKQERGVIIEPPPMPPVRPDVRAGGAAPNPRAGLIDGAAPTKRYGDPTFGAKPPPVLGRDGHAYQSDSRPGFGPPVATP